MSVGGFLVTSTSIKDDDKLTRSWRSLIGFRSFRATSERVFSSNSPDLKTFVLAAQVKERKVPVNRSGSWSL